MKDGTVLVYFCPVMGGHLFLDENLGTVVVVVQYSSVCDVFESREKVGSYTHRIHSLIENSPNISQATYKEFNT